MGNFKLKELNKMGATVADGAQCTTTDTCKTTTSCCATYGASATGAAGTGKVCIPAGSAKGTGIASTAALSNPTVASGSKYYPIAECKKAAGSASLAVSAAAAATALYAMY